MSLFRIGARAFVVTALLATAWPCDAQPAQDATAQVLRSEIDQLKQDFNARLAALESRLSALEGGQAAAQTPQAVAPGASAPAASATAAVPSGAEGGGGPSGALPVYGNASAASKVFNPDAAVIGNFIGAAGKDEVNPIPALALPESELSMQAIVDPYARADFFFSFGEQGVSVEEGYLTFPTIPGGFLMKVGRQYEAFGKQNTLHSHVLPWADRPLIATNLLGSGDDPLADAGVSVARLIPNPWFFLEATGQVFHGTSNDVFQSSQRSDVSYLGHVRGYQDLSEATNIELGVSYAHGHNGAGVVNGIDSGRFTTALFGVDATLRWRPLQRSIYHSFIGRGEVMWSRRATFDTRQDANGFYVSGDYQFARRWFAGVRFDRSERAVDANLLDTGQSAIVTYWPSEFSQIRGQYRRTKYAEGPTANEMLFQFQFAIGAHGAHPF